MHGLALAASAPDPVLLALVAGVDPAQELRVSIPPAAHAVVYIRVQPPIVESMNAHLSQLFRFWGSSLRMWTLSWSPCIAPLQFCIAKSALTVTTSAA